MTLAFSLIDWWHQFDLLTHVEGWMSSDAGYFVMFGLLFGCGLGVPLPEDIPLLLSGFFVRGGQMNLALACVAGWCGIMGGDCCLYWLGRRYGLGITKVPILGSHLKADRIEKVHGLFEKHGIWVVAVGRLFAGIRGAMVFTAGTIRFRFWHFVVADGIAAVFSGGMFIALGYYGRREFGDLHHIRDQIELYQRWVLLGVSLIVAGVIAWNLIQRHRRRRARIIGALLGPDVQESKLSQNPVTKSQNPVADHG